MLRDINNYPHKKVLIKDSLSENFFDFRAVPTAFALNGEVINLDLEVWETATKFNTFQAPMSSWHTHFRIEKNDDNGEIFEAFQNGAKQFLGLNENYQITSIAIDLQALTVEATARHKTRTNKIVFDKTIDLEDFELVKIDYPELVQNFVGFAFSLMASHPNFSEFE